jgi:hypothetical protein
MEFLANATSGQGAARNIFRGCVFQMLTSVSASAHINVGASAIDRYALFDDCAFLQGVDSGQSAAAAAIVASASSGGSLVLNNCITVGFTAVAGSGPVYINQISASGATTTFIGLKAT